MKTIKTLILSKEPMKCFGNWDLCMFKNVFPSCKGCADKYFKNKESENVK